MRAPLVATSGLFISAAISAARATISRTRAIHVGSWTVVGVTGIATFLG